VTIENLVPILRTLAPEFFANVPADDQRPLLARPEQAKRAEGTNDALPSALRNQLKSVETEIKYAGYLQQQSRAIDRLKKAEQRPIPDWFDYKSVSGLSREMQEKLTKIRPRTIAHASRIPGVTHAAVSLVNVFIEIQAKRRSQVAAV
jgi:tRNA uridine 5-carboxymethylaminomethyl modification enzyme